MGSRTAAPWFGLISQGRSSSWSSAMAAVGPEQQPTPFPLSVSPRVVRPQRPGVQQAASKPPKHSGVKTTMANLEPSTCPARHRWCDARRGAKPFHSHLVAAGRTRRLVSGHLAPLIRHSVVAQHRFPAPASRAGAARRRHRSAGLDAEVRLRVAGHLRLLPQTPVTPGCRCRASVPAARCLGRLVIWCSRAHTYNSKN